jgi:hypothetical protein
MVRRRKAARAVRRNLYCETTITDRVRRNDRLGDGAGARQSSNRGGPREELSHGHSPGHADALHYVQEHDALGHTDQGSNAPLAVRGYRTATPPRVPCPRNERNRESWGTVPAGTSEANRVRRQMATRRPRSPCTRNAIWFVIRNTRRLKFQQPSLQRALQPLGGRGPFPQMPPFGCTWLTHGRQ